MNIRARRQAELRRVWHIHEAPWPAHSGEGEASPAAYCSCYWFALAVKGEGEADEITFHMRMLLIHWASCTWCTIMQLHDAPDAHRSAWLDLHDGHMRLQWHFYGWLRVINNLAKPGYPSTNLADLHDHIHDHRSARSHETLIILVVWLANGEQ